MLDVARGRAPSRSPRRAGDDHRDVADAEREQPPLERAQQLTRRCRAGATRGRPTSGAPRRAGRRRAPRSRRRPRRRRARRAPAGAPRSPRARPRARSARVSAVRVLPEPHRLLEARVVEVADLRSARLLPSTEAPRVARPTRRHAETTATLGRTRSLGRGMGERAGAR